MDSRERLELVIDEAGRIKRRHIDPAINWYQKHSRLPRILFRMTGYSLIILSVSLPFLTSLEFQGDDIAVSVVALLIAVLAGVSSFAQWDSQWRGYKRAQFSLESLQAEWEIKTLEARQLESYEEANKLVLEATKELIHAARMVITSETEQFFEAVKAPQVSK